MTRGYLACAFDLLNVGDLDVIKQARRQCDRLVVGVYSDEYVEQLNGRPPVVPLIERMELIKHLRDVDEAVVHDHEDSRMAAETELRFTIADGQAVPAGAVSIIPARQSESVPLLEALAPLDHVGVA